MQKKQQIAAVPTLYTDDAADATAVQVYALS